MIHACWVDLSGVVVLVSFLSHMMLLSFNCALEGGLCRRDVIVGGKVIDPGHMNSIIYTMSKVFEKMYPEGRELKSDLVREMIDVTCIVVNLPQNVARECMSIVFEINAKPCMIKVKFVEKSQVCAVCLDEISKGDEVIWMPCFHVYHGSCILTWLEKKHTCPMCRMSVDKTKLLVATSPFHGDWLKLQ